MKKEVIHSFYLALCTAIGNAIYQFFFSAEQLLDFYKVVFIFVFSFLMFVTVNFCFNCFKRENDG